MPTASTVTVRTMRAGFVLATVLALTSCLGELASPGGSVAEATIDLRGLTSMSQVADDTSDEVRSARFIVFALSGATRREVATRLFTSKDFDIADSDTVTVFKLTFPYTNADDKFEVLGYGFSAFGDTLYRVGPAAFSMTDAKREGNQAAVSLVVPPVYVGPGVTASKLTITPRPVTTEEGKTTALVATLTDASGKVLSSPTFRFRWYSMDNSIAHFRDERIGVVTGGQRPGSTRIVAVFESTELRDSVAVVNTVRPAQLKVINGNNQTGRVGAVLGNPITVQMLSASGVPIGGVPVAFTVTQGGGSVNFASRTTEEPNGVASVSWTLGATVGTQLLTASVAGLPSVTVTANATAAAAAASQSTVTVLPTAIRAGGEEATVTVTLRDAGGNPVPNTVVTFTGSATAIFAGTSATTNASGVATARVHASLAGSFTVVASVDGHSIGTVTVAVGSSAVGTPSPASIAVVSGDNQTVRVGQNFPQTLTVVVRDASGSPVAGALVDWATTVGDGRKVTDANGQSSATYALPANWAVGAGTVTVTVTGTALTATFRFTAVP